MPVSVAIVEDDPRLLESLAALIRTRPDLVCLGTFPTAETAIEKLSNSRPAPDVVVVDLRLPDMDGISFIRQMKGRLPKTRFLMLTIEDDAEVIFRALEAGASGYLVKRLSPARVLDAIVNLRQGGTPLSSQVARLLVEHFNRRGTALRTDQRLTGREAEILDFLCRGLQSKEIATRLAIGVPTVNSHLQHIYEKLQVHSRAEAVAKHLGTGHRPPSHPPDIRPRA